MRCALKYVQSLNSRCDSRNNLRSTRATTNNRNPFIAVIKLMVPLIGVEALTLKTLTPLKIRNHGITQRPLSADDKTRLQLLAIIARYEPIELLSLPGNTLYIKIEPGFFA